MYVCVGVCMCVCVCVCMYTGENLCVRVCLPLPMSFESLSDHTRLKQDTGDF